MGIDFNAKDIYKRLPKVPPSDNPLRSIRGLYVSGPYLPIVHQNNLLQITKVISTKPTIVDYTAKSEERYGSIFAIKNIEVNMNPATVISYTVAEASAMTDHILCIKSIDVDMDLVQILKYGDTTGVAYGDAIFAISDIDMNVDYTITRCQIIQIEQFDSSVLISRLIVEKAKITNVGV